MKITISNAFALAIVEALDRAADINHDTNSALLAAELRCHLPEFDREEGEPDWPENLVECCCNPEEGCLCHLVTDSPKDEEEPDEDQLCAMWERSFSKSHR